MSRACQLLLILLCLLAPCAWAQTAAQPAASDDTVLRAMKLELDRSMAQLKLGQMQAPYYVEYSVVDLDQFLAEAEFGAIRTAGRVHSRFLRAVVRVGSYQQDSYYGRGQGQVELMPVEDDLLALRHQLWLATDQAYKNAIESLAAKQARLKQFQVENPVDDFAREPAFQQLDSLVRLDVDQNLWTRNLEAVSALYREDAGIQSFGATLRAVAVNRYFVNSEGTVTRRGQTVFYLSISGSSQAADGMHLYRSPSYVYARAAELPSLDWLKKEAGRTLATLKALRQAPVVEDEYRGPVLFDSEAAVDVVDALLAPNVAGHKPELGVPARTTGQFANSYHSRVLPGFLSLVDDPKLAEFEGHTLVGSYPFDDEGVPAKTITVVERGELVNYLVGRQPIRDFTSSNGHGRAGARPSPAPHIGTLILRAAEATPPAQLKKKLLEVCAQRSLQYCYLARTMGPQLHPRLLYRVWVKDGREELVRGAVFADLDTRALRSDLVAAGDDPRVENRLDQNLPATIIAPSLLFEELPVRRVSTAKEKLPAYPPPPASGH